MPFPYIVGVNLIPGTGEFAYDTVAYSGRQAGASAFAPINSYHAPGGTRTDVQYALDQLQAELPNCAIVAIVVVWFANSLNAATCQVYPSSTFIGGAFEPTAGGSDGWRVCDVTLATAGLIPISRNSSGTSNYGGTPSDQSIVRCIQEIKSRGLKAALYPLLSLDTPGKPWRAGVTFAPDVSAAATSAVESFLGAATPAMLTQDATNLTVHYSGSVTDFTYRRFVLHYANLAALAGGVSLFALGSELGGLESIRGPAWTPAGTTDAAGNAVWDYPFVAGLLALADDCRSVFDAAGLTKNLAARENLIVYSPDWTQWTGAQHSGAGYSGIWPHLDSLYGSSNIDLVSLDNYMPLSDWTTGTGGLDATNWRAPAPTSWPVAEPDAIGFELSGAPDNHNIAYLQANIEGGEKFDWFYADYAWSQKLDPNGALLTVTAPQGDRLAQARNAYSPGQQLFAFKQIRWWWNSTHRATYDDGDGQGMIPRGPQSEWVPQSKSVCFLEYGFPTVDRGPNENNKFFDATSVSGGAPFWSVWNPASSAPLPDDTIALLALEAFCTYWMSNNATSASGAPMIATDLMFAWCWDARPLPDFPLRTDVWADGVNWRYGHWLNGKLPAFPAPAGSPAPSFGPFPTFPSPPGLAWSMRVTPHFSTVTHERASGKSGRRMKMVHPLYEIELTFDLLRGGAADVELQALLGFFESVQGQALPFWLPPPGLATLSNQLIGTGDGVTTSFPMVRSTGGFTEPLAGVASLSAVRVAGVTQAPSSYSLSAGYEPSLTFVGAPASGAAINVDGEALWLCRFAEATLSFEQFAYQLFELKSVKLVTVKL
ncbi:MAG TPA: glycoside hydrolase TIM-barrel-like domain-containing protein [Roseiarcus sp.]|nr:glycoside hydrolase TIM-barrel-like domain-containing protein [Roseiarcus sp.]